HGRPRPGGTAGTPCGDSAASSTSPPRSGPPEPRPRGTNGDRPHSTSAALHSTHSNRSRRGMRGSRPCRTSSTRPTQQATGPSPVAACNGQSTAPAPALWTVTHDPRPPHRQGRACRRRELGTHFRVGARQAPRTSACRNRSRRRRHLGRREARRGQRGTPHQLVRGVPGPGAHQPLPSIGGELTMANCTTYLYNDPRLGCALPSGHDGPHVTGSGRGWHDSDDMDGGVAAALIEKEAEESPSVDYETMWWEAERRAEKAEAERDRWHSMWRQRRIKQLAAEKRATRAEA